MGLGLGCGTLSGGHQHVAQAGPLERVSLAWRPPTVTFCHALMSQ
ncbi:hypothetical protein [Amycolatopsis acidicola]|nr:hypothetical protein [Amycolatopsis acidicola]